MLKASKQLKITKKNTGEFSKIRNFGLHKDDIFVDATTRKL